MLTRLATIVFACAMAALGHAAQLPLTEPVPAEPQQQGEAATPAKADGNDAPDKKAADHVDDRILGVMPNHGTVKDAPDVPRISAGQSVKLAVVDSFDPFIFVFVGAVAGLSHVQHQDPSFGAGVRGYTKRFATAFADNTVGNFVTTAFLPVVLHQDPRYFQLGTGSFLHRLRYAASRTVIARSLDGQRRFFNISEIGGNAICAGLTNVYRPVADRSVGATLTVWETQLMVDTIANTAKEFWPDIHRRLPHR